MKRLPNFSFVCEGNKGKKDHRQLIILLSDSRYSPITKKALKADFNEDDLNSESLDFYVRSRKSTSGSYSDRTYWLDDTDHPRAKEETVTTPRASFYCPHCRKATPPQSKDKLEAILKHQLELSKTSFNIGLLFES